MALKTIDRVLPLPARATEVLEAFEISAEVGPHNTATHRAERVLKIRINLDLERKQEITPHHTSFQITLTKHSHTYTAYLINWLLSNKHCSVEY